MSLFFQTMPFLERCSTHYCYYCCQGIQKLQLIYNLYFISHFSRSVFDNLPLFYFMSLFYMYLNHVSRKSLRESWRQSLFHDFFLYYIVLEFHNKQWLVQNSSTRPSKLLRPFICSVKVIFAPVKLSFISVQDLPFSCS